MGLRCSLFGHAFEEPVTERDRETRGAEVLISVREVRRCSRCGDEQVIAENTEVRRLGPEERDETADAGDTGMAERLETAEGSASAPATEEVEEAQDDREREPPGSTAERDTTDAEATDTEDISQYVDSAEDPQEAAEAPQEAATEASDGSVAEDEDVEILGDEPDTETAEGTEADQREATEETPERDVSADDGGELLGDVEPEESAEHDSEVHEESADERPPEPDSEPADHESAEDDVTDDAIIIDNDAGQEDRESDIGRRELAGTGNMFDTGDPEADLDRSPTNSDLTDFHESGDPEPEADQAEMVEEDTETGDSDHEPWPGEDDSTASADPGFQFGPEMQTDESAVDAAGNSDGEGSGFTTESPVDVEGETADSPPKAVVCPECGYETRAIGSSLRAGDICPECHSGYLAERR